jgi:hypothetical protein
MEESHVFILKGILQMRQLRVGCFLGYCALIILDYNTRILLTQPADSRAESFHATLIQVFLAMTEYMRERVYLHYLAVGDGTFGVPISRQVFWHSFLILFFTVNNPSNATTSS